MTSSTGRRPIVIKTQIVRQDGKSVAVILDYQKYLRLKEIEEDRLDYQAAAKTKAKNRK
jgi:hypothetical protein